MNRKQRRTLKAKGITMADTATNTAVDPKEEETRAKYTQLCTQAGDAQVRINELHGLLNNIHQQIEKLKAEYAAAKAPKTEGTPDATAKA